MAASCDHQTKKPPPAESTVMSAVCGTTSRASTVYRNHWCTTSIAVAHLRWMGLRYGGMQAECMGLQAECMGLQAECTGLQPGCMGLQAGCMGCGRASRRRT